MALPIARKLSTTAGMGALCAFATATGGISWAGPGHGCVLGLAYLVTGFPEKG